MEKNTEGQKINVTNELHMRGYCEGSKFNIR